MTTRTHDLFARVGIVGPQPVKRAPPVVLKVRNPDGSAFRGVVRGRIEDEQAAQAERDRIAAEVAVAAAARDAQERSDLAAGFAALRAQVASEAVQQQGTTPAPPAPVFL